LALHQVGRRGPSFHQSALPALALLEQALPEQALAAVGEVELAPPFYRTLQRLASKRRGLFRTIKRFSFPSYNSPPFPTHLWKTVLLDIFLLHNSYSLSRVFIQ
jgi:hypothetical protein